MLSWLKNLTNVIFPILCPACEYNEPYKKTPLCLPCTDQISWIVNSNDARSALIGKDYFPKGIIYFDSLLYYTKSSRSQNLLKAIKYGGNKTLANYLGTKLGDKLERLKIPAKAVLVPVPLHPQRYKQRGYNQAEEIAKGIVLTNSQWEINNNLIKRQFHENSQTKKGKKERGIILTDSFITGQLKLPSDTPLFLIDDVITTGSTAAACTNILKTSGYSNISILSLAISI